MTIKLSWAEEFRKIVLANPDHPSKAVKDFWDYAIREERKISKEFERRELVDSIKKSFNLTEIDEQYEADKAAYEERQNGIDPDYEQAIFDKATAESITLGEHRR